MIDFQQERLIARARSHSIAVAFHLLGGIWAMIALSLGWVTQSAMMLIGSFVWLLLHTCLGIHQIRNAHKARIIIDRHRAQSAKIRL